MKPGLYEQIINEEMNVVWRLADEIPAKYIKQTRKMLVS